MNAKTAYSDLVIRFSKLPLGLRSHIADEMLTQLQPGSSPEQAAHNTIGHLTDISQIKRLRVLIRQAEGADDA